MLLCVPATGELYGSHLFKIPNIHQECFFPSSFKHTIQMISKSNIVSFLTNLVISSFKDAL